MCKSWRCHVPKEWQQMGWKQQRKEDEWLSPCCQGQHTTCRALNKLCFVAQQSNPGWSKALALCGWSFLVLHGSIPQRGLMRSVHCRWVVELKVKRGQKQEPHAVTHHSPCCTDNQDDEREEDFNGQTTASSLYRCMYDLNEWICHACTHTHTDPHTQPVALLQLCFRCRHH